MNYWRVLSTINDLWDTIEGVYNNLEGLFYTRGKSKKEEEEKEILIT